jgi:hydrogenase expression/formation protein HypC
MCLGIPGKVLSVEGNLAKVDILGVEREVSIVLVDEAKVDDYVIVHAGSAISIIDEDEAIKTMEIFKELAEIMDEQ